MTSDATVRRSREGRATTIDDDGRASIWYLPSGADSAPTVLTGDDDLAQVLDERERDELPALLQRAERHVRRAVPTRLPRNHDDNQDDDQDDDQDDEGPARVAVSASIHHGGRGFSVSPVLPAEFAGEPETLGAVTLAAARSVAHGWNFTDPVAAAAQEQAVLSAAVRAVLADDRVRSVLRGTVRALLLTEGLVTAQKLHDGVRAVAQAFGADYTDPVIYSDYPAATDSATDSTDATTAAGS